jgi:hypothetical protein
VEERDVDQAHQGLQRYWSKRNYHVGEQGRTTGEGVPTPTQVRASSRPVEITALERPSLGRGGGPSMSDGGRNPQPQQPQHVTGRSALCGGSRTCKTPQTAPPHSRRPWAATGWFHPRAAQYAPASYGPRHRK